MLNIWYLRNETSYEDIRHGVRKLQTPSLWSEKFCQHLVNRCCLNLNIGQNEQIGQKLLKMDLKMSENTVLGYKKGLKTQTILSDFENMYFQLSNALSIVFIRCLDTKIHNIEIWAFLICFGYGFKKKKSQLISLNH